MPRNEDSQGDASVSGPSAAPRVPVSAEAFAARRRRIVSIWIGAGVLVSLLATWSYRHSVDPIEAQKAVDEGRRLLKATRYPEAILSFDHALALKSDLPEAYLLRGRANMALSRLEPAVEDFNAAIRLQPAGAEAFVERAAAHLRQENYPAVIADCGEALARDPRIQLAYNLRGIALRQLGNPQAALADLNRSIELAPDESNFFQRAATYQMLGQHKLALADLDQVIVLKPDGPQAYFARAQSRRALGDSAGANQDHRQGLLLDGH